jgi:hypothetical protein
MGKGKIWFPPNDLSPCSFVRFSDYKPNPSHIGHVDENFKLRDWFLMGSDSRVWNGFGFP